MKAIWLQAQSKEDKAEYEKLLRNGYSSEIITRLKQILSQRSDELASSEIQLSNYDTPNWACKQAHVNGMRHIIKWVEDLLDFEKV